MSIWRSGSAVASFPLAIGTPLGGYIDRTGPSSDTLDDLEIGAFVLHLGERQLAIVTADVVGVDAAIVEAIGTTSGIPRTDLLVAASHTHSGPRGIVERLHPADSISKDPKLRARFIAIAVRALAGAEERCEAVSLATSEWHVTGAWSNRNDPQGSNDSRLRMLTARRADGTVQTAIVLVACHPTILGASSTSVSADLMGGIRRSLAAKLTEGQAPPVVLGLMGAAGDISTRFTRRESTHAEIDRLADLATAGWDASRLHERLLVPDASSLVAHRTTVTLPSILDAPATFDPEATMRAADRRLQELDTTGGSEAAYRQAITRRQGAYLRTQLRHLPGDRFRIELDAWRIDDRLALLNVPGELFTSLGARIERGSPFAETWISGYGNGYVGYIADRAAYESLTYEAMASPFAPGAGLMVTTSAERLLSTLRDL